MDSGIDLFRFDEAAGEYRFAGLTTSFPSPPNTTLDVQLASDLPATATPARYLLHLPLHNTVVEGLLGKWQAGGAGAGSSLWNIAGVDSGAVVQPDPAFTGGVYAYGKKPIVWCVLSRRGYWRRARAAHLPFMPRLGRYGTSILQGGASLQG